MPSDGTLAEIRELMLDTFKLDDIDVHRESTAKDIEEWDSLKHIRLMVAIERKYKIRFTNADVESLRNVGDLVDAVDAKVAGKSKVS